MIHRQGTRQPGPRILAWFRVCDRILGMTIVAASFALALAAPPGTITSLAALHSLTNDEAPRSIPAAFEATVIYYVKGSSGLFVQDGGLAIYVEAPENMALV